MNKKYVVMGKGVIRSVGLEYKSSAIKYADYFRKKGGKPRIYKIEEIKLRKRFLNRKLKRNKKQTDLQILFNKLQRKGNGRYLGVDL